MAERTLQDHIHAVLAAADDSMKFREVADALAEGGITADESRLRTALREGEIDGRFVRGEMGGCVVYTNGPEQVKPRRANNHVSAWPLIEQILLRASQPMAASVLIDGAIGASNGALGRASVRKAISVAFLDGKLTRHGTGARNFAYSLPVRDPKDEPAVPPPKSAPAATPVDAAKGPDLLEVIGVASAPFRQSAPATLGLRDRVSAIATDIEDAIGDACDAALPHDVIKALTVANGATQRALRALGN